MALRRFIIGDCIEYNSFEEFEPLKYIIWVDIVDFVFFLCISALTFRSHFIENHKFEGYRDILGITIGFNGLVMFLYGRSNDSGGDLVNIKKSPNYPHPLKSNYVLMLLFD